MVISVQPGAISASGKNNVWIAGDGIASWNGRIWRIMLANPGEGGGQFTGVSTSGPDNVWAIWSGSGSSSRTALYHWNGHRWNVFAWGSGPLKSLGALVSVSAASRTDVWVAGNGVERWNGNSWQRRPSPAIVGQGMDIASIDASVRSGTWILAGGQSAGGDAGDPTQVDHWNGQKWVNVGGPVVYWYGQPTLAVDASTKSVWAAGLYSVKRWSGRGWNSIQQSVDRALEWPAVEHDAGPRHREQRGSRPVGGGSPSRK